MQFFLQDEIIIKQNDVPDNFYLICEGIVEVTQEQSDFKFYDYFIKQRFMQMQIN